MTLLTERNLEDALRKMRRLEPLCLEATGKTPYEIGCDATGARPLAPGARRNMTAACVPVTAGRGTIGGFCPLVAHIVRRFTGANAFVTTAADVTGVQEALSCGADVVFLADDATFIACNVRTGRHSDNATATGRAFAAFLASAGGGAGGGPGGDVLVLGAGKVGAAACRFLDERGVGARWHDVRPGVPAGLDPGRREPRWDRRAWKYILDATTEPALVGEEHVTGESVVAAPGMPFGLSPEAAARARLVVHDELALGVVAMFCESCSPA